MFSFCPFFTPFYSKMVWGTVIVCIIYTTGYKTPLCHSPESTYRCGCTVYKHMYCNKIILRAWLPHGRLLSPGLIEGTLRFWVQTKSLQISHWHNGHFVPLKQSFQESCSYRCTTAAISRPGIYCPFTLSTLADSSDIRGTLLWYFSFFFVVVVQNGKCLA